MTNPPTTLEFDGAQDARDHLAALRFRRLPVKGLVQRYAANETADDGTPLITFASSTMRPDETGTVRVSVVETARRSP